MSKLSDFNDLAFEDSLAEDWSRDLETVEVRLEARPTRGTMIFAACLIAIVAGRVLYLNMIKGGFYAARAEANANRTEHILAPRGLVKDRNGMVLAENRSVFRAVLNVDEYAKHPELHEQTLSVVGEVLGLAPEAVDVMMAERTKAESSEPLVIGEDLSQEQIVKLKALDLLTLAVTDAYMRHYSEGETFGSLLGYVSLPSVRDLQQNSKISSQDLVGKAGLESRYDERLQGVPGLYVRVRDAKGNLIHAEEKRPPQIGSTLTLAVDGEFQKYLAGRMRQGLSSLGRTTGGAIALDPQNGEVLALISFPSYDNNILSSPGRNEEKRALLNSPLQPLFDRMVSGNYSPGSVVKPLDSVALLNEKIVDPMRSIFSPGYLDVPNPYDPSKPTRYLDWRYQGYVNIYSAIAQSSDVYFYETVGGFGDIKGLGITRLKEWWQKFGFGTPTGIDLPSEGKGFLPDPEWKERRQGRPWLLGDTFNVSIGQGDLQVTPIQLTNAIASLANGGILYQPVVNKDADRKILADLTRYAPEIKEVQKGMRLTVTSALGTAHALNDLPFEVHAKTGSAQIQNNTKENAFFAGYIPSPEGEGENGSANTGARIVILILIEDAREGSLNAVPIGKDALRWYWEHRLQ